jgi:hypothetical protein
MLEPEVCEKPRQLYQRSGDNVSCNLAGHLFSIINLDTVGFDVLGDLGKLLEDL